MRVNFESVVYRATKSGKCACGKRTQRTKAFQQTLNPFNKRSDGVVKARADIIPELKSAGRSVVEAAGGLLYV